MIYDGAYIKASSIDMIYCVMHGCSEWRERHSVRVCAGGQVAEFGGGSNMETAKNIRDELILMMNLELKAAKEAA